jgi:diguanylate cyclase (GGDEF)-like protein/PAS domain S-box-containing protein
MVGRTGAAAARGRQPKARQAARRGRLRDAATLADFVRNLKEGVYVTTAGGRILDANPAFLSMFGVSSLRELADTSAERLFVDPARRAEELAILERDGSVREFEFEIRRPDGEVRTVLDTCYQRRDPATGEILNHGILIDISDRKCLERKLFEAAVRDPLTGCFNRRFLADLAFKLEGQDREWGAVIIDIDGFKAYNDRHGHATGDAVLVRVARFLMRAVRAEDVVVRLGGDEFLLLLTETAKTATPEIARRLEKAGPESSPVSLSLGWAVRRKGERVEDTIRRADQGLIRIRARRRRYPRRRATGSAIPSKP